MCVAKLNPRSLRHLNPNRAALIRWSAEHDWDLAVSLTFRGGVTEDAAKKTGAHFWNKMDKKIFKKSFERHNLRCERLCFLETGANNTNWHYHIIAKTPDGITTEQYARWLRLLWRDLGNTGIVKIEATYDDVGWAEYISKKITAFNADAFDVMASHVTG